MDILRKDRIRQTLTVDDRDCGEFQVKTGGKGGSDGKKLSMGAALPEVPIGGRQTVEDVNLEKYVDVEGTNAKGGFVNDVDLYRWLKTRRGRGRAIVKSQPVNAEGIPIGPALDTYVGILGECEGPESDANSSDEVTIKVTISVSAQIG